MINVFGEALIDAHLDGEIVRLHPGGGPFNTAVALGRLGAPVAFLGALSTDPLGDLLRATLASAGVAVCGQVDTDAPTPLAMVVTASRDGDAGYRFYLGGTAFEHVPPQQPDVTQGAAVAFVGSLALALDPPGAAVEEFALEAAKHCSLVIDPNIRPALPVDRRCYLTRFERLAAVAAVIKLSRADAAWLYPHQTVREVAGHLIALGATSVIATDGKAGAAGWTGDCEAHVPAPQVAVVDTVGAGDAFTAGLLTWLWQAEQLSREAITKLNQGELEAAMAYAAAAGAAQCTRASAWGPTPTDVRRLTDYPPHEPAEIAKGG